MIHGDLTSSNMILRDCHGIASLPSEEGSASGSGASVSSSTQSAPHSISVTFIDFGLSQYSASPEDRAVDLYVLERACSSAHSDVSPALFEGILAAYFAACRDPAPVRGKFEQVRLRGRKRLAFG